MERFIPMDTWMRNHLPGEPTFWWYGLVVVPTTALFLGISYLLTGTVSIEQGFAAFLLAFVAWAFPISGLTLWLDRRYDQQVSAEQK